MSNHSSSDRCTRLALTVPVLALIAGLSTETYAQTAKLVLYDPPKLQGVTLVGTLPKPLANNGRSDVSVQWDPKRWGAMVRLTANPEVLSEVLSAYESVGLAKARQEVSPRKLGLASDIESLFLPPEIRHALRPPNTSEFERIRRYRVFVERYKAAFSQLRFDTPQRIAFAKFVSLGEYDRVRLGFPIQSGGVPTTHLNDATSLRFEFKEPTSVFEFLPVAASDAETLLATLDERKVVLVASYNVIDLYAEATGTAVAVLEDEIHSLYLPHDLSKPLLSRKGFTKADSKGPGFGSGDSSDADMADATPATKPLVADRMAQLTKEFRLFNLNGIPVIGHYPYGILNRQQQAMAETGLQQLHDRVRLHYFPGLLDLGRGEKAFDSEIPFFVRNLDRRDLVNYLTPTPRPQWIGATEFERKENREAFLRANRDKLLSLAIGPPFRFAIIEKSGIGNYDFRRKGYPIDVSFARTSQQSSLELEMYIAGFSRSYPQKLTLPVSFKGPKFWDLDEATARKVAESLEVSSAPSSPKVVYELLTIDILDVPHARPMVEDPTRPPHSPNYYARVNGLSLFQDQTFNRKIVDIPVDKPPVPLLVSGSLDVVPFAPDEMYLSDRMVMAHLIESMTDNSLTPLDWSSVIESVYKSDSSFYGGAYFISKRLRHNPSWILDNAIAKKAREFRESGSLSTSNIEGGFYRQNYTPFFPEGFFGGTNYGLTDKQHGMLKDWMRHRVSARGGRFLFPCTLSIDTATGDGLLQVQQEDESGRRGSQVDLAFQHRQDIGAFVDLAPRSETTALVHDAKDKTRHHPVAIFPAIESHLRMKLAANNLELVTKMSVEDRQSISVELAVDIKRVEIVKGPWDAVSNAAMHIEPVHLYALQKPDPAHYVGREVALSDILLFDQPVKIIPFTKADSVAAIAKAEEIKALEASEKAAQDRELARIAEETRRSELAAAREKREEAIRAENEQRREEEERRSAEWAKMRSGNRGQQANDPQPRDPVPSSSPTGASPDTKTGFSSWLVRIAVGGLALMVGIVAYRRLSTGSLVHDVARLRSVLAVGAKSAHLAARVKVLECNDLPMAFLAIGEHAYRDGIAPEVFAENFESIATLEQQVTQLRDAQPQDVHATILDRAKIVAQQAKRKVDIELLLKRRKSVLIEIGRRFCTEPSLDSRQQLAAEIAAGAKICELISSLQSSGKGV